MTSLAGEAMTMGGTLVKIAKIKTFLETFGIM